jgi:hypothetical protein
MTPFISAMAFAVIQKKEVKMITSTKEQFTAAAEDTSIRPFRINIPRQALIDLRKRIAATKWPGQEISQAHPLQPAG